MKNSALRINETLLSTVLGKQEVSLETPQTVFEELLCYIWSKVYKNGPSKMCGRQP